VTYPAWSTGLVPGYSPRALSNVGLCDDPQVHFPYSPLSTAFGGIAIQRVNQVGCSDVTYIPMAKGFLYLVVYAIVLR
jgi:hypothetical protein